MSSTLTLKKDPHHTCIKFEICMLEIPTECEAHAIADFLWKTFGLYSHTVTWYKEVEELYLTGFGFQPTTKESVRLWCHLVFKRRMMLQIKIIEMYTV